MNAIKEWAATEFDDKSITHLVVSHHHSDHTGGVRQMIADGVQIVISEHGYEFFSKIATARCEVRPDALAQSEVDAQFVLVSESEPLTLADATNPITVYQARSAHAADTLFPLVESAGVLFLVDIYSPGLPPFPPLAQEARDEITRLGIEAQVQRVAGGHGGVQTLAQFDGCLADLSTCTQ